MQVFKFGGTSVQNKENVERVRDILDSFRNIPKIVVVSAIGKTTNALEAIANEWFHGIKNPIPKLEELYFKHEEFALSLDVKIMECELLQTSYRQTLELVATPPPLSYTQAYDSVVSIGELWSTSILSSFLERAALSNILLNAREIIKTDSCHTEAKVQFRETEELLKQALNHQKSNLYILQGFIGSSLQKLPTTLGREGSDYTAAVVAFCLSAEKLVIWKDVPGILNADPRLFSDTILLPRISYSEAIEMTYYGAQVIHPKTIKPLQNKKIPLRVKSFLDPDGPGTLITEQDPLIAASYPPIIVYKKHQTLFSISVKDYSFVAEDNMSEIFAAFSHEGLHINMMFNGAIYFYAICDSKSEKVHRITITLQDKYEVITEEGLELLTIRHFTDEKYSSLTQNRDVLITEKTRNTIQSLLRPLL